MGCRQLISGLLMATLTVATFFVTSSILTPASLLVSALDVQCSSAPTPIEGNHGFLSLKKGVNCTFVTPDTTTFFAIKTGGLKAGDTLQIGPVNQSQSSFAPPLNAGYIVSGLKNPAITFNFKTPDHEVMEVEYYLGEKPNLPLNGDLLDDFAITSLEIGNFYLNFSKTIADPVHVEIIGEAKISNSSLKHFLIDKQLSVQLSLEMNQVIRVKTSSALKDCSNTFIDSKEASHPIVGPATTLNTPYKCVNLFQASLPPNAGHYEVNFQEFLNLIDFDDKLIIDDGTEHEPLSISKSTGPDYAKQVIIFGGSGLAVIYESPRVVKPSHDTKFKLTVQAKFDGGVVSKAGPLNFPPSSNGQVRYLLEPELEQYAAVKFASTQWPQDVNVTISVGKKVVAEFNGVRKMPPIVALNEPNARMDLQVSAKNFKSLDKIISFESLTSHCHGITSSRFSVSGGQQGPCYWILNPPESSESKSIVFNIDYNNLTPNGCLAIHSALLEKPIYSKCELSPREELPPFILKNAFINVTIPSKNTQLDASLSDSHFLALDILESSDNVKISSPGHPWFYPWSSENQIYTLNGKRKNYLLTIGDTDVRTGEKLLVNNVEIKKLLADIILRNTTANIEVVRSDSTSDFSHRQGFNMTAHQFDEIVEADMKKSAITIPKNLTSVLLKISSPSQKSFGKRIRFNVTSAGAEHNFNYTVYDGRSILSQNSTNESGPVHGVTTSDTLLIVYKVGKNTTTLPEITVQYSAVDCNKTADHFCDELTRCIPPEKLCKGFGYCDDLSDLKISCGSTGPIPIPRIIEQGVGSMTVFFLCVFMLILGSIITIYGPDVYKMAENRFRSGRYTTFTSVE